MPTPKSRGSPVMGRLARSLRGPLGQAGCCACAGTGTICGHGVFSAGGLLVRASCAPQYGPSSTAVGGPNIPISLLPPAPHLRGRVGRSGLEERDSPYYPLGERGGRCLPTERRESIEGLAHGLVVVVSGIGHTYVRSLRRCSISTHGWLRISWATRDRPYLDWTDLHEPTSRFGP